MVEILLKRATQSFIADVDGVERLVHAGEVLPTLDPVVRLHGDLFEDDTAEGTVRTTKS
jgi:hypothetical protein